MVRQDPILPQMRDTPGTRHQRGRDISRVYQLPQYYLPTNRTVYHCTCQPWQRHSARTASQPYIKILFLHCRLHGSWRVRRASRKARDNGRNWHKCQKHPVFRQSELALPIPTDACFHCRIREWGNTHPGKRTATGSMVPAQQLSCYTPQGFNSIQAYTRRVETIQLRRHDS